MWRKRRRVGDNSTVVATWWLYMKISKSERDSCLLSERNLKVGARTLKECGFVVIEDAICCSWVDRARAACDRALKQCMDALTPEEQEPLQRTNVPMFPPVCSPFWDAVAIENPLAVQVSEALIGRDFFCTYYNTNTQWPQSGQQHVHRDFEHLFVGHPVPLPISQIVVNIPLIDFTIENGATEVWPGSHLIVDDSLEDSEVMDETGCAIVFGTHHGLRRLHHPARHANLASRHAQQNQRHSNHAGYDL
jgi:hypothetical protein